MSHVATRAALERTRHKFLEQPAAARNPNASAAAVWRSGLTCEIAGPNGEAVATDMPRALGGEGGTPNPGWLLRAALASCAATVIAMEAARRDIALDALAVEVHSEADARGLVGIAGVSTALDRLRMSIRIGARDVSEDQLRVLAEAGQALSPVGSTLAAGPPVTVEIDVV